MPLLRLFIVTTSIALTLLFVQTARADRYNVPPGSSWETFAPKLKPGDEIVLAQGVHQPAVLTGVSGAPFAPIVIRSSGPNQLAEIAADRESIKLVDCRHIRIERILSRSPRRAGILIESTKPGASADITIEDALIVGPKGLAEESGIVARGVKDLAIRRCRIENPKNTAITISDCDAVTIADVQIVARTDLSPNVAVRLEGRVWSTLIERMQVAGPFVTAFELGTLEGTLASSTRARADASTPSDAATSAPPQDTPKGNTANNAANDATNDATNEAASDATTATPQTSREPLVRFLTISNIRITGVRRLLDVGSVADAFVRNVTLQEAHEEIYRITLPPAGRPSAALRMSECLMTWTPGALRRIGVVAEGASAKGFVLGGNLWWSAELPAALTLLGDAEQPFAGTVETPQTMDVDPKLDLRGLPTTESAKAYGYTPG